MNSPICPIQMKAFRFKLEKGSRKLFHTFIMEKWKKKCQIFRSLKINFQVLILFHILKTKQNKSF